MPTVPVYDTPQVMGQNLPDVRQQTPQKLMQKADIGPGEQIRAGQAGAQFAGTLASENTMDQIAINENQAKEYDAQLVGAHQAIIQHYQSLPGKDAIQERQATIDKISALPDQLGQTLGNPAQQQLVAHLTALRTASTLTQINAHYDQQSKVYGDSVDQTRAKVEHDATITAYDGNAADAKANFNQDDPIANSPYQMHLQGLRSAAASYAQRHGLDQDAAADQAAQGLYASTTLHLLNQAAGGNPAKTAIAKAYYDQIKDALTPEQRDKLAPALQEGDKAATALQLSIALGEKFDPSDTDGKVEELKFRFKSGEITADVYHAAMQNVKQDQAEYHQQVETNQVSMISAIADMQRKNSNLTINQLPASLLADLQKPENGKLYQQVVKMLDPGGAEARKTDPSLLFDIITHLGTGQAGDIAKMSNAQFLALQGSLTPGDFAHWTQVRRNAQDGLAAARADATNVNLKGVRDTLNSRLGELKINISPKASDLEGRTKLAEMHTFVSDYIRDQQVAAGHRFTDEEAEKNIDRLFATNVEFRTKFAGISTGTSNAPLMGMGFNDLPDGAAEGLRAALVKAGNKNPTNSDILNLYRKQHLGY